MKLEWDVDTAQIIFSALQLPVPLWIWFNIKRNHYKQKRGEEIDEDAPVLLPIYTFFIYLDIFYIIVKFILYGFLFDRINFGKRSRDPIQSDAIHAFLYIAMGEGITVFVIIVLIGFQIAPSAGRYALWNCIWKGIVASMSFTALNVFALSSVSDRNPHFIIKILGTLIVNFWLLNALSYMRREESVRWQKWLYVSIYATLAMWLMYTVAMVLCMTSTSETVLTIMSYVMVVFYCFLIPLVYYWSLLDDSKYWRNLEYYLLPPEKFHLNSRLLDHDGLSEDIIQNKGYLDDHFNNFKIPLVDWTSLDSTHTIIGKGGNAVIWKAFYKQSIVAVKEVKMKKICLANIREFLREALLSVKFDHENILKFHGVCVAPPNFLMVCEWCNEGDLGRFLSKEASFLTAANRLHLAIQATQALTFFHKKGFVHRDLKPQNYLMHRVGTKLTVKLADFGSCRSEHDAMPIFQGISPVFAAPEIRQFIPEDMKNFPKNAKQLRIMYGPETDIFAFAWVLWAILYPRDWNKKLNKCYRKMMRGWTPNMVHFVPEFRSCLNQCWSEEPQARPTVFDVFDLLTELETDDGLGAFFTKTSSQSVVEMNSSVSNPESLSSILVAHHSSAHF